ncbi:MAG TPA: single-stranded-DNA-specific exonuclease RecJ [Planctomycetaceae bacterium]|nr:single-stranded-DNA-specific exonuclease RecJ [Planctomycetaceae bacterium]
MPKVWRFCPHDESCIRQLSGELRISPLLAQVLIARGYASGAAASAFLTARLADLHEPALLPGVEEAAERIVAAIRSGRRITVYGDYDVDGVTATSILWHCLKLARADVDYYIPCRLEEGYGLHADRLRALSEENPGRLVVSVDCGIGSVAEAAVARDLGLELIITDHHQFGKELPDAAALVHPRLPGSKYPFGDLCGAGVAFKLAWAVCQRLGDGRKAPAPLRDFLVSAVGLAAIATVADVVPLCGENRILVRYGLETLVEKSSPGLQALLKVAGLNGSRRLAAEDVAFSLAPRINAAGRLGQARLAVELLTTDNAERAAALAEYLDQLNNNRKTFERRIFKQAKDLVAAHSEWTDDAALVLVHEDWHPGVLGIVATRVAEHFEKPAVLLTLDRATGTAGGSGRSFAGFDLHAGLEACREHLASFGGHTAAAGLRLAPDRVDDFRRAFCEFVACTHEVVDRHREMRIDAEVRLADVTHPAVRELDRLGPFGCENPRPIFAASQIELAEPPRRMGEGERHLSLRVRQFNTTLRAIAFGRGEWADEIAAASGPLSLSFTASINSFRGQERVELRLEDWQAVGR